MALTSKQRQGFLYAMFRHAKAPVAGPLAFEVGSLALFAEDERSFLSLMNDHAKRIYYEFCGIPFEKSPLVSKSVSPLPRSEHNVSGKED